MVMSPQIRSRSAFTRWSGAGAVGIVVIVAAENLALPSSPSFDASGDDVLRWIHGHHAVAACVVATFAITAVCLAVFVGGFVVRAFRDGDDTTRHFAVVGAFGAVVIGALFGMVVVSELMLLALDGSASATPALAELVWHLHAAAFVVNFVAIGGAAFGVGNAAVRLGLAPAWCRPMVSAGLVAALAAAVPSSFAVNGGATWQIAFVTFLGWLLLLLVVGIRMLRESGAS